MSIFLAIMLPFLGTTLGSAMVFFVKDKLNDKVQNGLLGFASGVMVAASVWSLIIPAMDLSSHMGKLAFIPAIIGFLLGMGFLLLMDEVVPHLHIITNEQEGMKANLKRTTMLMLAMTIHNFPEGAAAGAVLIGVLSENAVITFSGALALSLGIAIQNFPEGAVISLPLVGEGMSKTKAFFMGMMSGIVEPIAAIMTFMFASSMDAILPYLLSFAAGAMIYVVVEELIPESNSGAHSNIATIGFALGFALMMVLDIALA